MKDIYMQFLTIACHGRKRGHENMLRLAKSPYVLKVFNYDENSDSYLMENATVMFMIIWRIIRLKMIS